MTCMLAKAMRRMAVHILAAEKGLVAEKDADGHEAELEDDMLGVAAPENWGCEYVDQYLEAFGELMEASGPEPNERVHECDETEHDPWGEGAGEPLQAYARTDNHANNDARVRSEATNAGPGGNAREEGLKRRIKCKANINRLSIFYPFDQARFCRKGMLLHCHAESGSTVIYAVVWGKQMEHLAAWNHLPWLPHAHCIKTRLSTISCVQVIKGLYKLTL